MNTNPLKNKQDRTVAVIGGGITGLTAAFRLQEAGIPVTVYESGGRVGGVIRSIRRDGYLAEAGPNTILETSPKVAELVADLGLEDRRLYPDPRAKNRYVVRNQRLVNMPSSPLGFASTPLFSPSAKLRLLAEPFIRRAPEAVEESVAQFVVRRLGREFLDHAIDGLVSGIYAGDPDRLSVPQAFPKLHKLEQRYGSLLKGQILGARERKRSGEVAKPDAPKFSFDEGLQVLTDTLYSKLGEAVRLYCAVAKLEQLQSGWLVTAECGGYEVEREHSAVLYAGTAFRLAQMQIDTNAYVNWPAFSQISYPPVASVALGFHREDVAHPLDGFGMLIPHAEEFNILGTIFSSSLFPNRAPAGHVLLTSYLGGARSPDLASRSADELYDVTWADLRQLLGITGKPTFRQHVLFPKAIPQYEVGFGRFRTLMRDIESKAPGFFLAGHYRDGISLADSIVSATAASARVDEFLVRSAIETVWFSHDQRNRQAA